MYAELTFVLNILSKRHKGGSVGDTAYILMPVLVQHLYCTNRKNIKDYLLIMSYCSDFYLFYYY